MFDGLFKTLLFASQRFQPTGRPMVGSFSAASNIMGTLTDTKTVSRLLHRHGALALWDYATAG